MALVSIPFTTLQLVEHSAGGVIVRNAGGYIAHTFVGAEIAGAFAMAGTTLQTMGSSAAALAANPYIVGTVAIAAVAVGAYCYFYGVPAPVAETLVRAGLAAQSKSGLMVAVPKLATALVLLGAAGYVTYRFFENLQALRADQRAQENSGEIDEAAARSISERYFGPEPWKVIGEAVWATQAEIAGVAAAAIERVTALADAASISATRLYRAAADRLNAVVGSIKARLQRA